MPENMTHNLFANFEQLGRTFGETGQLDPALLGSLAKPERYPAYMAPVFKLFVKLPVSQFLLEWAAEEERRLRAAL